MTRWGIAIVALGMGLLVTAPAAAQKDDGAAAALGGIIGFGTGYYYLGAHDKGPLFTAIDGGLVVGLILTDDRDTQLLFGLGLLGSHIFQAVDGLNEAHRRGIHYASHPLDRFVFGAGDFGFFNTVDVLDLRAEGGFAADQAGALLRYNQMLPALRFHADVTNPGVGVSYRLSF